MRIFSLDAGFRVVGVASTGEAALAMARRFRPDVITMDVHLPDSNGLDITRRIMADTPTPIIIVSDDADRGEVSMAITALQAGALALLPKPSLHDAEHSRRHATQLLRTVKAMVGMKLVRQRRPASAEAAPPLNVEVSTRHAVRHFEQSGACVAAVAIAASTGGPAAVADVLSRLPADFPAPVFVVQHMAAGFLHGFAQWLDSRCALRVGLAKSGERVVAGHVYVAPEDVHLTVGSHRTIVLDNCEPVGGFRPSANALFASVAQVYQENAVGVVLTGMGSDGLQGAHQLARAGAVVIAQDAGSSVVYGMPRAVVDAGLARIVLSPAGVADTLAMLTGKSLRLPS